MGLRWGFGVKSKVLPRTAGIILPLCIILAIQLRSGKARSRRWLSDGLVVLSDLMSKFCSSSMASDWESRKANKLAVLARIAFLVLLLI